MKKIIPLLFTLFMLVGCSQQNNAPALSDDFSSKAEIKVGDFSYSATIKWHNNKAFITANTTNAKGLTLCCDGVNVTYSYGRMLKKADINRVTKYNPALILYQVFSDNVPIKKAGNKYTKCGILPVGKYELIICETGLPQTLSIDNFCVSFKNW